jgi:hypothetical protein
MNDLETLDAMLDMTKEAEELASDIEKSERLRLLIAEIRLKAKEEHKRLRRVRPPMETPYQHCMIEILEECDFGKVTWLRRVHEGIDRTIQLIKSNRLIM